MLQLSTYLNTVLEAVQLPACISDLDTGLTDVDRDALSHGRYFPGASQTVLEEGERGKTRRELSKTNGGHLTESFRSRTKMVCE
jgi:hypothetical protein